MILLRKPEYKQAHCAKEWLQIQPRAKMSACCGPGCPVDFGGSRVLICSARFPVGRRESAPTNVWGLRSTENGVNRLSGSGQPRSQNGGQPYNHIPGAPLADRRELISCEADGIVLTSKCPRLWQVSSTQTNPAK